MKKSVGEKSLTKVHYLKCRIAMPEASGVNTAADLPTPLFSDIGEISLDYDEPVTAIDYFPAEFEFINDIN